MTPQSGFHDGSRGRVVAALGFTQMLAWASSIYLPAILAQPMASQFGLSAGAVFSAYSAGLLVMAVLGPKVGGLIDRHGGRPVLCASNLVLAAALVLLALAGSPAVLALGWLVLGAGMALGLYDAAFAALVRHFGPMARGPIIGITLVGGFASTLGWPLSSALLDACGWRGACLAWAAIHVFVALPLNRFALPGTAERGGGGTGGQDARPGPGATAVRDGRLWLLGLFGVATAFVTSAMSAHLPGLLTMAGVDAGAALFAAALFGPAQVAARLVEHFVMHRRQLHPLLGARLATMLHPLGALLLIALGGSPLLACVFAVLHGAGNGMITIAKGTLPLALFGPAGYGARQGWLATGQRVMLAGAPAAFGWVMIESGAAGALWLSTGASLLALAALMALRANASRCDQP